MDDEEFMGAWQSAPTEQELLEGDRLTVIGDPDTIGLITQLLEL